jgi:hypothetical protein
MTGWMARTIICGSDVTARGSGVPPRFEHFAAERCAHYSVVQRLFTYFSDSVKRQGTTLQVKVGKSLSARR